MAVSKRAIDVLVDEVKRAYGESSVYSALTLLSEDTLENKVIFFSNIPLKYKSIESMEKFVTTINKLYGIEVIYLPRVYIYWLKVRSYREEYGCNPERLKKLKG